MKSSSNDGQKTEKAIRAIGMIASLFGVLLLSLLITAYGLIWVICKGPSPSARDLFVTTCMETSFAKLFPPLVLSRGEIAEILEANAVVPTGAVTNDTADFSKPDELKKDPEQAEIEVLDVTGPTYKGKMMIVKDPSRIIVGTPPAFGKEADGIKLDKMVENAGAVAGINAGGFEDDNGVGTGGVPIGIVIRDGKLVFGKETAKTVVIGLDDKNALHVGTMTAREALDKGMRDAVSFGPVLIVNGEPVEFVGNSSGLNPRTAIGQRKDGSVLLLVIDGRQPHSIGATYKDLVDVMQKFGAVNAGNLDGGSSSMLYYNGKLMNTCASLYGPRKISTGFLVRK